MKMLHINISSLTSKGFTIIELLVSIAISGIVMVVVTQLFTSTNKIYTVQDNIANMQQDIRAALNVMGHDIRMAGYGNGTISNANSTNISFTRDDNPGNYQYKYDVANKCIEYNNPSIGSQGLTEIGSIDSMQFSYALANGTNASNPSNPDKVRVVIVNACGKVSGAFEEDFNSTYCFKRTIKCRNMGLN